MENPLYNWQQAFEVSDPNSSDLSALLDTHPLMYLKEQEQDSTPLSSSLTGFCNVGPPAPKPNMSSTKDPILLYINDMLLAEKMDHLQDLTNNTSCASDLSWKELEMEDSLWPMEDLLNAPLQFDDDTLDDGMVWPMESLFKGPLPQLCDESLSCSKVEVEGWINEALHEVDAQCEAHVSSLVCAAASSPLPEVNSPQILALWHYNESIPEAALGCDEEGDDSAQLASVWHDSDVENMGNALQGKNSHLEVDLQEDKDDQVQQYFAGNDAVHTDPCRASLENQSPRGLGPNQSDLITDVEVQHVHVDEKVEGVTACNGGVKVGAEIKVAAAAAGKKNGPRRRKTAPDKRRRQNSPAVRMWREVAPTMVDLRGLLVSCAEAVASNNAHAANEKMREIWRHASPLGNGIQRLAHYFAQGLAARLSGTGGLLQDHRRQQDALASGTVSSNNDDSVLRAYHTYVAVCPFLKLSHFFANEATLSIARDADCLHIIDFNILYGFQWPCFLKALAERAGGPPALRLTGVDVVRPGKPGNASTRERLADTGRRLEEYALAYGIPFKYRGVTLGWEGVSTDTLRLRAGETVVVNCIYRLRHLMDDTTGRTGGSAAMGARPREAVLARIRGLNPALFVEGVVNARYNAPFFMSRFKEAMFHYSSMFDALDATIRKDLEERLVIERDIMGPEILNVVACEGVERLERPETCREWQLRTQSVGFEVLPVDPILKGKAQAIARGFYHKDYGVEDDEHGRWLLLGWKGRMLHGISSWRPS